MMKKKILIGFSVLVILIIGTMVYIQNALNTSPNGSKSWVLTKIESIISSPDMTINISNIEGALWSQTSIRELTIADRDGVWLKLDNVVMDWNRLGLIAKNVNIETLHADRIDVIRKPLGSSKQNESSKTDFVYPPELPVAIYLQKIDIPIIEFEQNVFGLASQANLNGQLTFADKELVSIIDIQRLDDQGKINLAVNLSKKVASDNIHLSIEEPQNGILANLANLEGRPALALNLQGQGSWTDLSAILSLDANQQRIVNGTILIKPDNQGYAINSQLKGPIAQILPENLRRYVGEETLISLDGHISPNSNGTGQVFTLGKLHLSGPGTLDASGSYDLSSHVVDMQADLTIPDMAKLHDLAQGPLALKMTASGAVDDLKVNANLQIQDGKISGRSLKETTVNLETHISRPENAAMSIQGDLAATGNFSNEYLVFSSKFTQDNHGLDISNLLLELGENKLSGSLKQTENGLFTGQLQLKAPNIENLAALALMQGKGMLNANIALNDNNGKQEANIVARAQNLSIDNHGQRLVEVAAFDSNLVLYDLFGALQADGTINANTISAAGYSIHQLQAKAETENTSTRLSLNANVQNNVTADISGLLIPMTEQRWQLQFDRFNIGDSNTTIHATQPFALQISSTGITISSLDLNVNDGHIKANGVVGDDLGIEINMDRLPLSIANLVKPDLGLSGTLSGGVNASGSKTNPDIAFNVEGHNLSASLLREKNIPALNLDASGETRNNLLNFDAALSGGGLDVKATGKVPMGEGNLDVNVNLHNLPVALANGFVDGQNLGGTIQGTAHITGSLQNPNASFNLTGQSLSAKTLVDNGLAPLNLKGNGSFANQRLTLESFNANGPQNLNINIRGSAPLSGNGVDLKIDGSAPLGLANKILAERGASATGTLTLNATVQGSLANPKLGGSFSVANGQFIDAESNLRLNSINVAGNLNGDTVTLTSVNATSSAGGDLSANGSISTNFAQGMPTNLTVNLNHFRYNDGQMVVATVNGQVTLQGALMHDPVIGGDVTIEHAEITVPNNFGGATAIDVQHKNTTKPIATTLKRAGIETDKKKTPTSINRPNVPQLKMRIRAPNQIFVRGRGLDVELGGQLGLIGPVNNIRPVGGFNMLRGRFDIMTQRLTFDEGRVTLVGNLNPELYFVAKTESNETVVTITVSGTADNIKVAFTSQPELPQDEVLAQLIFNRSIGELSPFQIAQLAAAAAELAGMSNNSLLGALRSNTGLDDLDVITDAQGNTGVRAGRYIRDNIYLGVEAGSGGNTKGTVNLDITKDLKAKGAVGSEGDSSVGVFYEKDY